MKKTALLIFITLFSYLPPTFSQPKNNLQSFNIESYFEYHLDLDFKVYNILNTLSDTEMVSQLIMPAAGRLGESDEYIYQLLEKKYIGGVLLLNGTKEGFKTKIDSFNAKNNSLPLLYSADAELSLINRKISGTEKIKNANKIKTKEDLISETSKIAQELNEIGIHWDFAPVVDASPNKVVGFRSFSSDSSVIVSYSLLFNQIIQKNNILATAKHFPGHGFVVGDTHKKLVYIDGTLKEVKHYPPLIEHNVASVMVGHLAIKNNEVFSTDNMPATLDKKVITSLLKDSLNFKGIIVTDAMNMGGVSSIKHAGVKAIQAGCDVLLMPLDVEKFMEEALVKMNNDKEFKNRVYESAFKIVKMKICLGLIDDFQ